MATNTFEWANNSDSLSIVTPQFIVPDENKPNLLEVSDLDNSISTVDMSKDNETLIRDISKACEEYGFFKLINHKIPLDLCDQVLDVITNFFHLPYEQKKELVSPTHMEDGKIFKYYITKDQETKEKVLMWGEAFFHTWHPDGKSFVDKLPINPSEYRVTVAKYIKEVASLINQLLSLISQALGLPEDYLQTMVTRENSKRTAQANYYPPCPEPDKTLGLRDHTDLNILTVLLANEGVGGLQVLKDGKWFTVKSERGSLIVNVADQLQVLSNDRYKSACHRVVNNKTEKRTSFAVFVGPELDAVIAPIEELLSDDNPALYRPYKFSEFMDEFRNQTGKRRIVKDHFRIDYGSSGPSE